MHTARSYPKPSATPSSALQKATKACPSARRRRQQQACGRSCSIRAASARSSASSTGWSGATCASTSHTPRRSTPTPSHTLTCGQPITPMASPTPPTRTTARASRASTMFATRGRARPAASCASRILATSSLAIASGRGSPRASTSSNRRPGSSPSGPRTCSMRWFRQWASARASALRWISNLRAHPHDIGTTPQKMWDSSSISRGSIRRACCGRCVS